MLRQGIGEDSVYEAVDDILHQNERLPDPRWTINVQTFAEERVLNFLLIAYPRATAQDN